MIRCGQTPAKGSITRIPSSPCIMWASRKATGSISKAVGRRCTGSRSRNTWGKRSQPAMAPDGASFCIFSNKRTVGRHDETPHQGPEGAGSWTVDGNDHSNIAACLAIPTSLGFYLILAIGPIYLVTGNLAHQFDQRTV